MGANAGVNPEKLSVFIDFDKCIDQSLTLIAKKKTEVYRVNENQARGLCQNVIGLPACR
jgi:hypothetical protein